MHVLHRPFVLQHLLHRVSLRQFMSTSMMSMDQRAGGGNVPQTAAETATATVAVAQMTSVSDVEQNFQTCSRLAEEAAARGAKVLFLPENFNFLGRSPAESLAIAEPLTGPTIQRYRALAKRLGLWLSLGGFQEQGPDPDHLHNCHVVVDAAGEIAASSRKIHLFDVDVPGGPVLMESGFTAPGEGLAAADSPAGRLGLSVCYDLRFPAIYQRLAFEMGAEVLLVPSAFTVATGEAHWEVLLRARAIECQCYVVAAAQAGQHNEKRQSYGHSLIVDPWGTIVATLEDPHATGIALAEIDLAKMRDIRRRMPVAEHRAAGAPRLVAKQTWPGEVGAPGSAGPIEHLEPGKLDRALRGATNDCMV